MKKYITILLILFVANATQAQIQKVTLQASGLTCSMCSKAIYKSLMSLNYVEKVDANISNSSFDIKIKPASIFELEDIKKKVEDAGFFVANLSASLHFDNEAVQNDGHTTINGTTFHFVNIKNQTLNGDKTIKVIDKGYVSDKTYKLNNKYTSKECYKTGLVAACCSKDGLKEGTRIYHVTL